MTGCSWKSRLILADRSPAMITVVISFIIKIIITITIIIIIKIIITTGYSWQRRLILADRSPGTITGCLDSTSTRHRRTFQHTSSSFENVGLKSSIFIPQLLSRQSGPTKQIGFVKSQINVNKDVHLAIQSRSDLLRTGGSLYCICICIVFVFVLVNCI